MHDCCGNKNSDLNKRLMVINNRITQLENLVFGPILPVNLPFKRLHPMATLPAKSGDEEAGWDFTCVPDANFLEVVAGNSFSRAGNFAGIDYLQHINFYGCNYNDIKIGDSIITLLPGDSYVFNTGVACAIDTGYCMLLWDRSGMGAKKKIHRLAGVIDCTYRGEWAVCLVNHDRVAHCIKAGDKIIQGIITRVIPGKATWVDELPPSYRGEAGFGSTGR